MGAAGNQLLGQWRAVQAAKGLGVSGFGVSEEVSRGAAGKLVSGAHLMTGPEGSRVGDVCLNQTFPHLGTPTQNPGSKSLSNSRRQTTGKVLLVAREIGGKAILTSVPLLITALKDVLKIFLMADG